MRIAATPRIFIQSPNMAEAELFASWLNDPEVVKYSEQRHLKHTGESQKDYWTLNQGMVFTIYKSLVETPIGGVTFQIDRPNGVANVGIMIGDKSVWRKGYGFDAWRATCNYLFYSNQARKIEAGCMGSNESMIRICEKYGMTVEGRKAKHFIESPNRETDLVLYGKFHP